MSLTISALWHQLTGRPAPPAWVFEVDRTQAPAAVLWHWERHAADGSRSRSANGFPTFSTCARDAGHHGFLASHPYTLREAAVVAGDWSRPAGTPAQTSDAR